MRQACAHTRDGGGPRAAAPAYTEGAGGRGGGGGERSRQHQQQQERQRATAAAAAPPPTSPPHPPRRASRPPCVAQPLAPSRLELPRPTLASTQAPARRCQRAVVADTRRGAYRSSQPRRHASSAAVAAVSPDTAPPRRATPGHDLHVRRRLTPSEYGSNGSRVGVVVGGGGGQWGVVADMMAVAEEPKVWEGKRRGRREASGIGTSRHLSERDSRKRATCPPLASSLPPSAPRQRVPVS